MRRGRACLVGLAVLIAAGATTFPAYGQADLKLPHQQPEPGPKIEMPDLAEPVLKLLEASYLSDEERKDLRVFHGVWQEGDLDTPQRRARAALIRGCYDDASLMDPAVAIEDRAEAMMLRGELKAALDLLDNPSSLRAIRIRAESLEGLGRAEEAGRVLQPLVDRLRAEQLRSSEDLVEGVRGLMIRSQVLPQQEPAGGDFKRMAALLATARDKLGRLYWPAYVVEAGLLYDKDNPKEAGPTAMRSLTLNPSAAAAWSFLGRVAVDTFNFDGAEQAALRLKKLDSESSPLAAYILARARMRQNDPDGAADALRPALERFPKMRSLLGLQAAIAALRYDYDRAEELVAAFDTLSPGSADALYEVGRTLSEARQYDQAEKFLKRAAARAPFRAVPIAELGLLGLQSGRDAEAVEVLKAASALDPFNMRVDNTRKLAEELTKYDRVESEHFIVRYAPGVDRVLADDMIAPLEKMYARVTGKGPGGIDHEPGFRTVIDLMPNQRWFAVRIAGVTRIHTMAASTGPTIAMEAPREGPGHSVGTYDWLRVVRHEFTHTVTLSRTHNRIPHWFTEAAAVYLEDSPRDYQTCKLLEGALENDALFDFGEINIAFVRPKKRTDRSQAYAQGHWMYQYMIERWGERAPLDLMDRYAAGEREESAIKTVLGVSQAEFMSAFKVWAKGQLASWGMGQRPGEPTLAQILLEESASTDTGREAILQKLDTLAEGAAWATVAEGDPQAWQLRLPTPDKALAQKWLERYPTHPDLLEAMVGYATKEAGDAPDASMVPLLERYAAARPVDPLPHQLLARIYLSAAAGATINGKGPEGAIEHLEYLDAREQGSATYAAELARQYSARQDWPRAMAKAERAATIAPYDADYRELAATVALRQKDYQTALRHITALTLLEPGREIHTRRLEAVLKLLHPDVKN